MAQLIPLFVLVSSIWVAVDAASIKNRKALRHGPGGYGPIVWLLLCWLLWIFAFPIYLVRRGEALAGPDGGGPEQHRPAIRGTAVLGVLAMVLGLLLVVAAFKATSWPLLAGGVGIGLVGIALYRTTGRQLLFATGLLGIAAGAVGWNLPQPDLAAQAEAEFLAQKAAERAAAPAPEPVTPPPPRKLTAQEQVAAALAASGTLTAKPQPAPQPVPRTAARVVTEAPAFQPCKIAEHSAKVVARTSSYWRIEWEVLVKNPNWTWSEVEVVVDFVGANGELLHQAKAGDRVAGSRSIRFKGSERMLPSDGQAFAEIRPRITSREAGA